MKPQFVEPGRIPKIIHQTFRSKDLPEALKANVEKIKAMNPDWEYRFYDDKECLEFISRQNNPRLSRCFSRINPKYGAAKADLFRYVLIYVTGGVYLDIKSSLKKPLREIIHPDDCLLLAQWRNKADEAFPGWGLFDELKAIKGGEFQQWHIVAAPGHPYIKAVIDQVLRNIEDYNPVRDGVGQLATLRTTGPIAYTLTLAPLLQLDQHRFLNQLEDSGLVYSVIEEGDKLGHIRLFKNHYRSLREPLTISARNRFLWTCQRLVQKTERLMKVHFRARILAPVLQFFLQHK